MSSSTRLQSLDIFRGLTIAFMVLVNNPGSWNTVYAPLLHAKWDGCTPTDLVFPFFVFIVGVAIPFAFARRKASGASQHDLYLKIAKRVLLIFGIGVLLNLIPFFKWDSFRIPGVLQRIALCYGICAIVFLKANRNTIIGIGAGLLILYWLLMTVVPVPGHGSPTLEPETNLGAWFDRLILGGHLWGQSVTWDPEGLLGTIPASVTGLIGVLTGMWLREKKSPNETLKNLLIAGVALIIGGLIWGQFFPINKALWTSSYVLYTGGIAVIGLALCYWIIDVQGQQSWSKPFLWFGMNSLFIYALSSLFAKFMIYTKVGGESLLNIVYDNIFSSWLSPVNASLGYALFNVAVMLLVAFVLFRKKIFIKV